MNKYNYTVAGSAVKAIGFEEAVLKWVMNCIYMMYMLHSLENRHKIVLKTMCFAGKTAILLSERYKVFGSVAMYHQVLQCIKL